MVILIDNFSIDEGIDYYFTSLVDFSTDIIDTNNNLTSSGVAVYLDEVNVTSYIIPITNGFKVGYLTVPSGNLILTYSGCVGSNELLRSYTLAFGYYLNYQEVDYYKTRTEVPIFLKVDNNVNTSATEYFSTFFETRNYSSSYLEATITADGFGYKDIGIYIRPQSKWFFYGQTYEIKISGIKDFSGNILPEKIFKFTIENET
jgi:hypothetical protein